MEACNTHEKEIQKQRDLNDICEQFDMQDVISEKKELTDVKLLEQFTTGVNKSYYAYKE